MAAQSTYLANGLLDWLTGDQGSFTWPENLEVALYTTPIGPDGTGTEATAASGVSSSASREPVTMASAVDCESVNSGAVEWLVLHPSSSVAVSGWGIHDAATGDLLFYGTLSTPRVVAGGQPFTIPAGDLSISRSVFSVGFTDYLCELWLNAVLTDNGVPSPAGLYLTMFTTLPELDGSGGVEVSGGGYSRKAQTFTRSTDNQTACVPVEWDPLHTTTEQDIYGHGWYDASSGGNLLCFGSVYPENPNNYVTVTENESLYVGDLTIGAA